MSEQEKLSKCMAAKWLAGPHCDNRWDLVKELAKRVEAIDEREAALEAGQVTMSKEILALATAIEAGQECIKTVQHTLGRIDERDRLGHDKRAERRVAAEIRAELVTKLRSDRDALRQRLAEMQGAIDKAWVHLTDTYAVESLRLRLARRHLRAFTTKEAAKETPGD